MAEPNLWSLTNARVAQGPHHAATLDIEIHSGRIRSFPSLPPHHKSSSEINLSGMLILPGLVNAHDHLEFAIFPRLGNCSYANAQEWARDIYHPDQSPVRELLQVPKGTRLFWGGLKNLLCGVTTVCHHNQYEPRFFEKQFPVRVLKHFGWSHSFDFSPDVKADFDQTPDGAPFFIHLAEGTDRSSRDELRQLDHLGLLNAQTVIVHGVALNSQDWELARKRGARLVWCPSSNQFTLGRTLDIGLLPTGLDIALASDSPLTAAGDLLDEVRFAYQLKISRQIPPNQGGQVPQARGGCLSANSPVTPSGGHPPQAAACLPLVSGESVALSSALVLDPAQLYSMVTTSAAQLMDLKQGEGTIVEGGAADLLVVRDTGISPASRLVQLSTADVELVIVRGEIALASTLLASRLPPALLNRMRRLSYNQKECFVALDIQPHWEPTHRILDDNFHLAGKQIHFAML
jgi:cytosine/adenosine deaminase-related metal-dependent hydrolase